MGNRELSASSARCFFILGVALLALVALVCYMWIFCGNVMVVWIFFVNFVVEMLMDNRR